MGTSNPAKSFSLISGLATSSFVFVQGGSGNYKYSVQALGYVKLVGDVILHIHKAQQTRYGHQSLLSREPEQLRTARARLQGVQLLRQHRGH